MSEAHIKAADFLNSVQDSIVRDFPTIRSVSVRAQRYWPDLSVTFDIGEVDGVPSAVPVLMALQVAAKNTSDRLGLVDIMALNDLIERQDVFPFWTPL